MATEDESLGSVLRAFIEQQDKFNREVLHRFDSVQGDVSELNSEIDNRFEGLANNTELRSRVDTRT